MKLFNTLSGEKEEFQPQGDPVTMYVCGVNPYTDAHIGHAMSYIFFDVVRRYLEFRGYRVRHVQNITDIEDNIIAEANRLGVPLLELTEKYTARYDEDMAALNVVPAHLFPKATEEVDKIIEVVEGLVEKGFAYAAGGSQGGAGGDVYFRVRNAPDYGRLSGRSLEAMMAGARVEAGEDKEHPMDFVLWKAAKSGEPSWPSPWGEGRPGWHIECSAMSLKYLGETLDIHGGGQDLVFPHHENEIAQSESFTGKKPFARYWVHNGLLRLSDEKMSKSTGHLVTIREALEKFSADAIRVFILSSYYRSPITYSEETLAAAEKGVDRLRQASQDRDAAATGVATATLGKVDATPCRQRFIEAMDDDLGTAQATAALFDLAREINRGEEESADVAEARATLRELAAVLGLTLAEPSASQGGAEPFIELLLATRKGLREAKQFQLADEIRDRLAELGVAIEDGPGGSTWKLKR
jgi:cysteinyl-tRNA synthetase